jgi:hypothetical protein
VIASKNLEDLPISKWTSLQFFTKREEPLIATAQVPDITVKTLFERPLSSLELTIFDRSKFAPQNLKNSGCRPQTT